MDRRQLLARMPKIAAAIGLAGWGLTPAAEAAPVGTVTASAVADRAFGTQIGGIWEKELFDCVTDPKNNVTYANWTADDRGHIAGIEIIQHDQRTVMHRQRPPGMYRVLGGSTTRFDSYGLNKTPWALPAA